MINIITEPFIVIMNTIYLLSQALVSTFNVICIIICILYFL